MTPSEFRQSLERLGLTPYHLADRLADLGDTRPIPTIRRNMFELASLERKTPLPWSIPVILTLLERRK